MKFVVIGAGNVGLNLAERLVNSRHDVILIDKNEAVLQHVPTSLDIQVIIGNGCSPQVLASAGLAGADYLIAATDVDEVNISACLVGKWLSPSTKRVARLRYMGLDDQYVSKKQTDEYFDLIINPDQAAAQHLSQLLKVSGARDVVEFADGRLLVLSIEIKETSRLAGKRLGALKTVAPDFPLLIVALVRNDRLIVPRGKDRIRAGDIAYVITVPDKIDFLFELAGQTPHKPGFVMLWGGSPLSLYFADMLEQTSIKVKLIMRVPQVAAKLVDRFSKTLVLQGDGTDRQLLLEENVQDVDVFVAATVDEEDNILSSILAKKLGAKTAIAVVNNDTYLPLISALGIDTVVNPHLAAASGIFRFIHAGSVLSELSIEQRQAGFLEVEINHNSVLTNKRVQEIGLPNGILIAAIERKGDVIIPSGEDTIQDGDILVIFLLKSEQRKLEKLLHLKLGVLQ